MDWRKNTLVYRTEPLQTRFSGREVELSFSSEAPVERWFGKEILLHGPNNVDLKRIKEIGALIYGHDAGIIGNVLGKVQSAWIENRRGKATVLLDDDEAGNDALAKIKSGSLTGVSVGYRIKEKIEMRQGEEWHDPNGGGYFKGPGVVATLWEPYELSLTPIPADVSVGVGRSYRSIGGNNMANFDVTAAIQTLLKSGDREGAARLRHLQRQGMPFSGLAAFARTRIQMNGRTTNGNDNGPVQTFRDISDEDFFEGLKTLSL